MPCVDSVRIGGIVEHPAGGRELLGGVEKTHTHIGNGYRNTDVIGIFCP